ncbi:hypothetical protein NXX23_20735 [Bacteroides ovatus]|nr:hypothetical protein [Bacteroides ovatus]
MCRPTLLGNIVSPLWGDSRFVYICTPSGYLTDRKGTIPSFYLPIDYSKKQNYNF